MLDIDKIATEQRNERTAHIDELSTLEMVRLINDEDKKVAYAVEKTLEHIACAIDLITEKMRSGGRLIYCGCGTSGRLGILDAVECPPTYSTEPEMVHGIIAGGYPAVFQAVEGAEDDYEQGELDLKGINFSSGDILTGIAASGRTPYVIGAMNYAKSIGAPVISVTCSPGSKLRTLWPQFMELNFFETHTYFDVPVYFLQGRNDFNTVSELVETYYREIKAPDKKLIWFEKSGHHPMYEEKELYDNTLINEVLPLAYQ
jgi:phosphoheptose isomerase